MSSKEKKHLVMACGGTGGHFYPTIAIASEYIAQGGRVTLLLSGPHAQEQLAIAAKHGVDAVVVPAVRGPSSLVSALAFPFRMLNSIRKCRKTLKTLNPDVMLGMGSYAALPACLAKPANIPLYLHEGNAFMGKTNRILAQKAETIFISLPLVDERQLKGRKCKLTGMPLRSALLQALANPVPESGYLESVGLEEGVPVVLVFGGSQGARRINQVFAETAPLLTDLKGKIQFIHLTGTDDNGDLINAYRTAGIRAYVARGEADIQKCYLAAGLVICRGGASTLCELALFSRAAVIIPLPTAADDHQTANAAQAVAIGGAIHLPQAEATPEAVCKYLKDYLEHPGKYCEMGNRLHEYARPDAAADIARLMI